MKTATSSPYRRRSSGRDPNVLYKFTIDKGTNDGISKNDPVITDAGVVGFISAVNANYSQVTTLLSPDTKIAALVTTEEESGDPREGFRRGVAFPSMRRSPPCAGTAAW